MDINLSSISCVGSYVYKKQNLLFTSPLIGSLFINDLMYLKFLENYNYYINLEPLLIKATPKNPFFSGNERIVDDYFYIKLDDIEIQWIHEYDEKELREKWKRRVDRIKNTKKIFTWSASEFMQVHDDIERAEIIKRFNNLDGYSIFLTERKNEESSGENYINIFVDKWSNKQQTDRDITNFLRWNDQPLQGDIIIKQLQNIKL